MYDIRSLRGRGSLGGQTQRCSGASEARRRGRAQDAHGARMPVGTVSRESRARAVAPCSGHLWAEPGPAPGAALLCRFPSFLLFYIFEKPTHSLKKQRTNHTVTCFTFDGTLSHLARCGASGRSRASGQLPVKQAGHCPVSLTPCVLRNPLREAVPADRARQLKISWPRNAECPQNLLCCF